LNEPTPSHRIARLLLIGYVAFLVYASLYPISSFRPPDRSPLASQLREDQISRTDALANLLVYVPLGWLLAFGTPGMRWARAVWVGCALSFAIECGQAYLPGRVPSVLDWGLNTAGTLLGVLVASRFQRIPVHTVDAVLESGRRARLGLMAVATWAAYQLFPFVPSVDVDSLKEGLRPLWHVIRGQTTFSIAQATTYALAVLALSSILTQCLRPNPRYRVLVPAAFLAVLLAKVPIVSRQLSLEALLGSLVGLAISRRLADSESGGTVPFFAAAGGFVVEELRSERGPAVFHSFNWIPLRNNLENELIGAADILATAWPFLAMAYVASGFWRRAPRLAALGGAVAIFASVLALEWVQRSLPGRTPDVTDALIAAGAWLAGCLYLNGSGYASGPRPDPEGRFRSAAPPHPPPPASH
jgi:VanZ family protein